MTIHNWRSRKTLLMYFLNPLCGSSPLGNSRQAGTRKAKINLCYFFWCAAASKNPKGLSKSLKSMDMIFVYHLTISLSKFDFNVKFLILWVHIEILRGKNGSKNKLKVSFFGECTKMQLITSQNLSIQACFSQFLWFFSLKCWCKGQIISRIHLSLPNAYRLMSVYRNVNGNRNVKLLWCD